MNFPVNNVVIVKSKAASTSDELSSIENMLLFFSKETFIVLNYNMKFDRKALASERDILIYVNFESNAGIPETYKKQHEWFLQFESYKEYLNVIAALEKSGVNHFYFTKHHVGLCKSEQCRKQFEVFTNYFRQLLELQQSVTHFYKEKYAIFILKWDNEEVKTYIMAKNYSRELIILDIVNLYKDAFEENIIPCFLNQELGFSNKKQLVKQFNRKSLNKLIEKEDRFKFIVFHKANSVKNKKLITLLKNSFWSFLNETKISSIIKGSS
jgi:hypothetical protein